MMRVEETFALFLDIPIDDLQICREGKSESCIDSDIPTDFECLRSLIETYQSECGPFNYYSNNFIKYLVRQCENPWMPMK